MLARCLSRWGCWQLFGGHRWVLIRSSRKNRWRRDVGSSKSWCWLSPLRRRCLESSARGGVLLKAPSRPRTLSSSSWRKENGRTWRSCSRKVEVPSRSWRHRRCIVDRLRVARRRRRRRSSLRNPLLLLLLVKLLLLLRGLKASRLRRGKAPDWLRSLLRSATPFVGFFCTGIWSCRSRSGRGLTQGSLPSLLESSFSVSGDALSVSLQEDKNKRLAL